MKMYLEEKLMVEAVFQSNSKVANLLNRFIDKHHKWGSGIGHLHLRNVKEFKWNQKYECRIYKKLNLNLRIKSRIKLISLNIVPSCSWL